MTHAAVRDWLVRNTPLEPTLLDGAGFGAMVSERVASAAGGSEAAYLELLGRRGAEVDRLIGGVAVSETWLFRYPRSFELLADRLRSWRNGGLTSLKMASIGCATGQEAWGMALAALHAGYQPGQVAIDAVDRNPEALATAAAGRYGANSIRGEIPVWGAPHLLRDGEWVRIDPQALGMVRFRRGDATEWRREGPLNVVFCRNLLIYLNASARAGLVRSICDSLLPGGLLFVGHAEVPIRAEQPLRPIAAPHTFALERVATAAGRPVQGEATWSAAPPPPRWPALRSAAASAPFSTTAQVAAEVPRGTLEDARALADAGRTGESDRLIRSIMAHQGPSAPALELLGLIRMSSDDVAGAKRLFEQAVYLEPAHPAALIHLAIIHEREGDARGAAAYWDRARRASAPVGVQERRP